MGTFAVQLARSWFGLHRQVWAMVASLFTSQQLSSVLALANKADLDVLREHLEAGRLVPVMDRSYPLAEVPAAIRALAEGHSRGKAVIKVR